MLLSQSTLPVLVALSVAGCGRPEGAVRSVPPERVTSACQDLTALLRQWCEADPDCATTRGGATFTTERLRGDERLANHINELAAWAAQHAAALCVDGAPEIVRERTRDAVYPVAVALAAHWPCAEGGIAVRGNAARWALAHASGRLFTQSFDYLRAPYDSTSRETILAAVRDPSRAPFRAVVVAAALRGRDPILGQLPWAEIDAEVAADAAERPLATMQRVIEGEIVELLALHQTSATVAAAMLARRLAPDAPVRNLLLGERETLRRVAATISSEHARSALQDIARGGATP